MIELSLAYEPRDDEFVSDVTLQELITTYYRDNQAGGNGHIVFDEGGYSDEIIRYCIQESVIRADWVCAGLLMELLKRHPLNRKAIIRATD